MTGTKAYACPIPDCEGGKVEFQVVPQDGPVEQFLWHCPTCGEFFSEIDGFGEYPLSLSPWDRKWPVYHWDGQAKAWIEVVCADSSTSG